MIDVLQPVREIKSSPLPPRRIPLLAQETSGHIMHVLPHDAQLLTPETSTQTAIWLKVQTPELVRLGVLGLREELVGVTNDLLYGVTNAHRIVTL